MSGGTGREGGDLRQPEDSRDEAGGHAAMRLREMLRRQLGEVPPGSPSEQPVDVDAPDAGEEQHEQADN